jgi:hypothetical protein
VVLKSSGFGFGTGDEEVVVHDPKAKLKALESEISSLEKDYQTFRKLALAEDPAAKEKGAALRDRLDEWQGDWYEALRPLEKDGRLPPEYAGYGQVSGKVTQIKNDLLKSSDF